jgi:hypothetical protein
MDHPTKLCSFDETIGVRIIEKVRERASFGVRILTISLVGAALVQFAVFTTVIVRATMLEPVADMFDWIDQYLRFNTGDNVLAYLWAPHNQHHMPLIRILTALDMSVFNGNEIVFVFAGTACILAVAAFIVLELLRDRSLTLSPAALAVVGSMLILTATAAMDCAMPIASVYPIALFFVVAALILFDSETERTRLTNAKRGVALLAALLAALANGVGLVVWPALLWTAWRAGAARLWLFAIVATGACYGFIYTHDVAWVSVGDINLVFDLSHFWKMFEYFLAYLALPLSRIRSLGVLTPMVGGVLLCMSIIAILHDSFSSYPPTRLQRIAIGLIIAGMASGLLAAVGRADLNIDAEVKVPVRYAMLVAPFQIGLLALVWQWLARRAVMLHLETVMLAFTAAACWVLVASQAVAGLAAVTLTDQLKTTVKHYNGTAEPGMFPVWWPDMAIVQRVRSALH